MTNPPRLIFGISDGNIAGFTSTDVTGFRDLVPAAIVRELVQNSMDAAVEAKRDQARITFALDTCKLSDIPGIQEYREAFRRAVDAHTKPSGLPDQAEAVVNSMKRCLGKDNSGEVQVLSVLDNGIGLNQSRMGALLADGISIKGSGASGAYGNGHVVVIPASDLRYVLYGGIVKSGERICSGHAVIASHDDDNGNCRSKDGRFIQKQRKGMADPFLFVKEDSIPPLISCKLQQIKDNWQYGSVVIIPAFNCFHETDFDLKRTIVQAVASNFFAAIMKKKLVVKTVSDKGSFSLDTKTIAEELEAIKNQKRQKGPFLVGHRAHEALQTLKNGKKYTLDVKLGKITLYLRLRAENSAPYIDLCRNGMWICGQNQLPGFYGHFSESQAFQCLLLLEAKDGGDLHDLVRKAEGQLHVGLSSKLLKQTDQQQLKKAFKMIREKIKTIVPKLDDENFRPDDILSITQSGDLLVPIGSVGQRQQGIKLAPGPKSKSSNNKNKKSKKPFLGAEVWFKALPVLKARSVHVSFTPNDNCPYSELRLAIDESSDVTCRDKSSDSFVHLSRVKFNNQKILKQDLICDGNGYAVGIPLKGLKKEITYKVEAGFALSGDLEEKKTKSKRPVVLKVMLSKTVNPKTDA